MTSPMKIIHTTSTFVMPVETATTRSMHQSLPSRSHFDTVRSSLGSGNGSETESGDEDDESRVVRSSPRRPPPATSKSLDGRFNVVRVSVEEIRSSIRRTNEAGELPSRSVSSPVSSPVSSFTRKSNGTNETRRSEDSISSSFRRRGNRSPSSPSPQHRRVLTLAQERALLKREEEQRRSYR